MNWKTLVPAMMCMVLVGCSQEATHERSRLITLSELAGLAEAEKFCREKNERCEWVAHTPYHESLLEALVMFGPFIDELDGVAEIASDNAQDVNNFLREQGVSGIDVPPLGQNGLGMAGVVTTSGAWSLKGYPAPLDVGDITYPGIYLPESTFTVRHMPTYKNPIAALHSERGYVVYVVEAPASDLSSVVEAVVDLHSRSPAFYGADFDLEVYEKGDPEPSLPEEYVPVSPYNYVHIPQIDHAYVGDSQAQGIELGEYVIAFARRSFRLMLSPDGFWAKEAYSAGSPRSEVPPPLKIFVIDDPFVVVVMDPKTDFLIPRSADWIPRFAWKEPQGLVFE